MNNQEEKVTNNKSSKIVAIILIVIAISLIGVGVYYYLDGNKSNPEEQQEKKKENKKSDDNEQTTSPNKVLILENDGSYKLYLTTSKYFETGEKELIADSSSIYDVNTYNNKVYYIDDSKKVNIYDIDTKTKETIDLNNQDLNFLSRVFIGKDYIIVSSTGRFELIKLSDKSSSFIDAKNNNESGILDSDNDTIYYVYDNALKGKNINTNEEYVIANIKGKPVYQDDKYIYVYAEENESTEAFYTITKKDRKFNKTNITDYDKKATGNTIITSIGNDIYLMFNKNDKIVKYGNKQESYILEKEYISYANFDNKLYMASAKVICNDYCYQSTFDEYYIYDPKDGKLQKTDNQYVKELITSYLTKVINVKE